MHTWLTPASGHLLHVFHPAGSFGDVWQATSKVDGHQYAIKMLDKQHVAETETIDCVLEEQRLLRLLHNGPDGVCPFIVQLHASFQDDTKLYIVMNLVRGGDMYSMLCSRDPGRLEANEVEFLSAELVLAIEWMHERRVAFRDLKAENLMITHDGHLVVADMGLAKHWDVGLDMHSDSIVGTPEYLPPEIIREDVHGLTVDLWGIGVLMYEMLVGTTPFFSSGDAKSLFVGILMYPPEFPEFVEPSARKIIADFMEKEPNKRLGAHGFKEVKEHDYFARTDWALTAACKRTSPLRQNVNFQTNPLACSVNIKLERKTAATVRVAVAAKTSDPFAAFANVPLQTPSVSSKLQAVAESLEEKEAVQATGEATGGESLQPAAANLVSSAASTKFDGLSPQDMKRKLVAMNTQLEEKEHSVAEAKEALRKEIDHEHHLEHVLDRIPQMICVKDGEVSRAPLTFMQQRTGWASHCLHTVRLPACFALFRRGKSLWQTHDLRRHIAARRRHSLARNSAAWVSTRRRLISWLLRTRRCWNPSSSWSPSSFCIKTSPAICSRHGAASSE